jgi:polyphosphate kinase 2 (PPK2 family)
MARREILDRIQKYVDPFRVTKGKGFRLKSIDPSDTCGLRLDKGEAADLLARGTQWLAEEQDMLYAQDSWSLLLVFQAMDAAGKDGTIKHVMLGVNPQGCQVFSFKQPSREDLEHDFMCRYAKCLPERGRIGIFNRSYYEEVLVVRVHQEMLKRQRLPARMIGKRIWEERLSDIAHFEDYLSRQGTKALQRRRVGEQELQYHDCTDAQRQVFVAEMRLKRQRAVQQVAAVQQIEHLPDSDHVDGYGAGELIRRAVPLHPEEGP